nr:MAG TPA: winged helix-turn-helix domain protein [Crassvirales sp.]
MNFSINKKETSATYIDRDKYVCAENKDIIKSKLNNNITINKFLTYIIAGEYNLNESDTKLLEMILNDSPITINLLQDNFCKFVGYSSSTFRRSFNTLVTKGIIDIGKEKPNTITPAESINIDSNVANNAKYLIVELKPNITSSYVTI